MMVGVLVARYNSSVPRYISASLLIALSVGIFAIYLSRIRHNPYYFWAPAIDEKMYGSLALNYLKGQGFRLDALEAFQFSEKTQSLDCYYFSFLHSFFIAQLMKWLGDQSFFPILYMSAFWMALCVPLAYFALTQVFSTGFAIFGTLLFLTLYEFFSLGPSGQSEPLMLVILLGMFNLALLKKSHAIVTVILSGFLLGLMNITRPTGMILLPAFGFLFWKRHGGKSLLLFLLAVMVPTLWTSYQVSQGGLSYNRLSNPLVETREFGGPSHHYFQKEPVSAFERITENLGPLLMKAWHYGLRMLGEPYRFWGDHWVFLPLFFLVLWERKKGDWLGFFILAFVVSVCSVVFYWYVPRVHLHLRLFTFFAALYLLYENRDTFRSWKTNLTAFAIAIPFFFLFTETIVGRAAKVSVQYLVAFGLVFPFAKKFRPMLLLGLLLVVTAREWNSISKALQREAEPSDLYAFQKELMLLTSYGVPRRAFILSDDIRDVVWFSGMRGAYIPDNLCEMAEFLISQFAQGIYIVHVQAPTREQKIAYSKCGYEKLNLPLEHVWVFAETGVGLARSYDDKWTAAPKI